MKMFNEAKGYATPANAERAATKKGIDLSVSRYMVIVNDEGRFNLCFPVGQNEHLGMAPVHMGFCVTN